MTGLITYFCSLLSSRNICTWAIGSVALGSDRDSRWSVLHQRDDKQAQLQ